MTLLTDGVGRGKQGRLSTPEIEVSAVRRTEERPGNRRPRSRRPLAIRPRRMMPSSIVTLRALDERGSEIIEELEKATQQAPTEVVEATDERRYYLRSADVNGFDAMLDRIDPNWAEHVARIPASE